MALYLAATMSYWWPLGRISRRLYREPGEQLVIGLPAAPVRPLAAYALVSVGTPICGRGQASRPSS